MSNFKSGSGNLDFDDSSEESDDSESTDTTSTDPSTEPSKSEQDARQGPDRPGANIDRSSGQSSGHEGSPDTITAADQPDEYPYFVRRSNVGDERATRLEIHVRDKVADQESQFRNELSEQLGTSDVSKTDAREFALLAAYEYPEQVAALMEKEGFGALK